MFPEVAEKHQEKTQLGVASPRVEVWTSNLPNTSNVFSIVHYIIIIIIIIIYSKRKTGPVDAISEYLGAKT
jgi:hypothetical protein